MLILTKFNADRRDLRNLISLFPCKLEISVLQKIENRMTEQRTDYDSPWKEVIEAYFPQFLEFFFPLAYAAIDWTQPYEFLDTELQQLEPDAEIGKCLVDKVAKVWLLDGEEVWVLT